MTHSTRAFELGSRDPKEVAVETLVLPEKLTSMILRRLPSAYGLEIIDTDVRVAADRELDAVARLESGSLVLISFRRSDEDNVVERVDEDRDWIFEHPSELKQALRGRIERREAASTDFEDIERAICIAAGFSSEEIEYAKELAYDGLPTDLVTALRTDDNHLVVSTIDTSPEHSPEVSRNLRALDGAAELADSTDTSEDALRQRIENYVLQAMQSQFEEQVRNLNLTTSHQMTTGISPSSRNHDVGLARWETFDWSQLDKVALADRRSTRFLDLLRLASEQLYDVPIFQTPGKTTLRIPRPAVAPGALLIFGVRKRDARVEVSIPINVQTAGTRSYIESSWGQFEAVWGPEYELIEDSTRLRIIRYSTVKVGYGDPEYLWPEVIDDLLKIARLADEAASDL